MNTEENMIDKLYFIGTKIDLPKLTNHVGLVDTFSGRSEVAYFDFWNNVCIIEYNRKDGTYLIKENLLEPHYCFCYTDKDLFHYLDEHEIQTILDDNPLGAIFHSYAMAYLELVRWAADVAYTREFWNNLIEG